MQRSTSTIFAVTAAALFLAACGKDKATTTPADGAASSAAGGSETASASDAGADEGEASEVKCFGINECSGQSACDVAGSHDCGGQNSCKGKGWILVSQSDCDAKGGKVL